MNFIDLDSVGSTVNSDGLVLPVGFTDKVKDLMGQPDTLVEVV